MSVGWTDFFSFLFNGGRGIRANQVDWGVTDSDLQALIDGRVTAAGGARQIHIVLNATYDTTTMRMQGSPYQDVDSIAVGDLIFFQVPGTIPNLSQTARLDLTLGGTATSFQIFDTGLQGVAYNEIVPGVMHRGIRVPAGIALINATGQASLSKRVTVEVNNAQIQSLNTDYIELVPAPGAGQYLEIERIWVQISGSDELPAAVDSYIFVSSTEAALTTAIAAAGTVQENNVFFDLPEWTAEDRYAYVGVHWTQPDILRMALVTPGATDVTRVPGLFEVGGQMYKFWRSNTAFASRADYSATDQAAPILNHNSPSIARLNSWTNLALLFVQNATVEKPLHRWSNEYLSAYEYQFGPFFRLPNDTLVAAAIGGHDLLENQALMLGMIVTVHRSQRGINYDETICDTWLAEISDRSLEIVVEYQEHSTFTI